MPWTCRAETASLFDGAAADGAKMAHEMAYNIRLLMNGSVDGACDGASDGEEDSARAMTPGVVLCATPIRRAAIFANAARNRTCLGQGN